MFRICAVFLVVALAGVCQCASLNMNEAKVPEGKEITRRLTKASRRLGLVSITAPKVNLNGDWCDPYAKPYNDKNNNLPYKSLPAKQLLNKYGYLDSPSNQIDADVETAIKEFQDYTGMEMTGTLDDETIDAMSQPRCAMPDHLQKMHATADADGQRPRWRSRNLRYKIVNYTSHLDPAEFHSVVEKSIKKWTGGDIDLKIRRTESDDVDLKIYFSPQDGPLKVLGYAFDPEVGEIYFDSLENWALEGQRKGKIVDFNWVATHEMGHALGLPHNQEKDSIMYPFYRYQASELSDNDKNRLTMLYGTASMSELCTDPKIDELLFYHQERQHLFFKGDKFWTISEVGVQAGPFNTNEVFKGFPGKIDAAFSTDTATYFVKGSSFYKYNKNFKRTFIKKSIVTLFENMPKNLDAAFYYPVNETIYFFKDSDFYTIRGKGRAPSGTVEASKISEHFPGIPDNVDAATVLNYGDRILFVKNDQFYIFDMEKNKLDSGPGNTKREWFKC